MLLLAIRVRVARQIDEKQPAKYPLCFTNRICSDSSTQKTYVSRMKNVTVVTNKHAK